MPYIPRSSASSGKGASAIPKIVKKKHTFRVFGFIASVMISGAFLSIIAAFGYKLYIEQQLSNAKDELVSLSGEERDLGDRIAQVQTFDAQLSLAEYLIENHLAPSQLFAQLEKNTKETIQYTSLTYTYDPGFQALLDLAIGTDAFNSVALQNNALMNDEGIYTAYLLGGITNSVSIDPEEVESTDLDSEEAVHPVSFNLSGEVDTSLITYTGDDIAEILEESLPGDPFSFDEGNGEDPVIENEEDVVDDTSPQELPQ